MGTTVIGMTGSFGSGCTKVVTEYLEPRGYKVISLSDILREIYRQELGVSTDPSRHELQTYGNSVRHREGISFLAEQAIQRIPERSGSGKWVIDSIRNPGEVLCLSRRFSQFYLISLYADRDIRWNRVKHKYRTEKEFDEDESRDAKEDVEYGQRVWDCHALADIIISNNRDYEPGTSLHNAFRLKVDKYIDIIEGSMQFNPNEDEAMMATAYTIAERFMPRRVLF